jgi:hypothetical protein
MKRREQATSGFQLPAICIQLKMISADGKSNTTDAVNTRAAFRIIQQGGLAKQKQNREAFMISPDPPFGKNRY